jgi:hypothetical protein
MEQEEIAGVVGNQGPAGASSQGEVHLVACAVHSYFVGGVGDVTEATQVAREFPDHIYDAA